MIRYSLTCKAEHQFESWFQSAAAFDTLQGAGHVGCPVCGSSDVAKLLMAPAVAPKGASGKPDLRRPGNPVEQKLAELRQHIEANSDYVGLNFVAEARKMHSGAMPERAIYGEAKIEDARALIEDGVPVAPLPFIPARKAN